MSSSGNYSYQTPGTYRVFYIDLSSVVISALSQYDARKKAQAICPGKLVSHAELISQASLPNQPPVAINPVEVKAKTDAVKTINLDI